MITLYQPFSMESLKTTKAFRSVPLFRRTMEYAMGTLLMVVFMLAGNALAQSCPGCNSHGCTTGQVGSGQGCFCRRTTHGCAWQGCPCSCEGNSSTGYFCSCYCPASVQAGAKTAASPLTTLTNPVTKEKITFESELAKATEEFKKDPPGQLELIHVGSASCLKGQSLFVMAMIQAALDTGHPIKFRVGGSDTDTLQDKLDAGESLEN